MVPNHIVLQSRAVITVTGSDWRIFLQGLVTQDVETLHVGELRFGGLLTPQGRLLYDLFLVGTSDGCLLDVDAGHRPALIQRLNMYRLRAKVVIEADDRPVSVGWNSPGPYVDPRLPTLGWRGYGMNDRPSGDERDYHRHCLALGVPSPTDWGSDKTYPIEANFDLLGGIDFQKGCFVGQETTSRMKRRGQIKSRMLPIDLAGDLPEPGTEILAGTLRAGSVLSGRDRRVMAILRLDRIENQVLTVNGQSANVEWPTWMPRAPAA